MQIMTEGIIIRDKTLSNDNHMLSILTKDFGVITAFERQSRQMKNRINSALELFSYSTFVLFYNKERYTVDKADSNKIFFGIREDIEKLSLASYFSELLLELAAEGEEASSYLKLFLNCLAMLESGKRSISFIKALFELRLVSMAGYMPDLLGCQVCGQSEGRDLFFLPNTGVIVCQNCLSTYEQEVKIQISPGELAAMRHIIYSDISLLFHFTMPEPALVRLSQITENYILCQLGKTFTSLTFFHSVQLPQ